MGDCIAQDGLALQMMIDVLALDHIPVSLSYAGTLSVTASIPRNRIQDAIKILHSKLVEPHAAQSKGKS